MKPKIQNTNLFKNEAEFNQTEIIYPIQKYKLFRYFYGYDS